MVRDGKMMDRITIQWQGMVKQWTDSLYDGKGWQNDGTESLYNNRGW